jgi:hypothetical protein
MVQLAPRGVYAAVKGARRTGREPADLRLIGSVWLREGDVLSLGRGAGSEGVKSWRPCSADLTNHGINAVFFVVCNGSKCLPLRQPRTASVEHDGDKRLAQLEQRWVGTGGLGRCDVPGLSASQSLREARRNMLGTRG